MPNIDKVLLNRIKIGNSNLDKIWPYGQNETAGGSFLALLYRTDSLFYLHWAYQDNNLNFLNSIK